MEQAVISKNTEYMYKFLGFDQEAQRRMVAELPEAQVLPLLELLASIFEKRDMRYECVLAIQQTLIWRKDALRSLSVRVREGPEAVLNTQKVETLKGIVALLSREKVDLNRVHELRGRMLYVREHLEERHQDKENVPVCRDQ